MRQTIQAIYLGHINYSETSVIGRFYTLEYGTQSFILKGVRKKKSKLAALLQPLNLVEISTNYRTDRELNLCFGLNLTRHLNSISMDIRKTTIALFLAEILNKSIVESEENSELYHFITSKIHYFEEGEFNPNFHHHFLLELSALLGFFPLNSNHKSETQFNLQDGVFEFVDGDSGIHLNENVSMHLKEMLKQGVSYLGETKIPASERMLILNGLVRYYETQLGLISNSIKSHHVLQAVFG